MLVFLFLPAALLAMLVLLGRLERAVDALRPVTADHPLWVMTASPDVQTLEELSQAGMPALGGRHGIGE